MAQLRRSERHFTVCYESNGRDYLASLLDFDINELEGWLASPTVRPHLLLWYNVCVLGRHRFNDALDWIKIGDGSVCNAYFYDKDGLEEDLLLMCLGEGNIDARDNSEEGVYADETARTRTWATRELWARAAWRVVQNNTGQGQIFQETVIVHPAAAYGVAIDLLCVAFHSIAFRQSASVWGELILKGEGVSLPATASTSRTDKSNVWQQVKLDQNWEYTDDEAGMMSEESGASSDIRIANDDDGDFEESRTAGPTATPEPDEDTICVAIPQAPKKKVHVSFMDNWPRSVPATQEMTGGDGDDADGLTLKMIDENGSPIAAATTS